MVYNFFFGNKQAQNTPQNQPIPGRESEMIKGKSGGYMFAAGIWRTLRRCLLIGTGNGSYYATKWELTNDFVDVLEKAIAEDPDRVAQEIVYASDGRSINNSAPIWALVLLSMGESPAAKKAFQAIFPQVIRTASHFYEWMSYTKSVRGFGKVVREAGKNWLLQGDTQALAYQLLKYQQRYGFSNRDALRLFHAKPQTEGRDLLFKWVVNGWDELPPAPPTAALNQIWWYEWLKRNPDRTPEAISQGRLTHEMAAPVGKMDVAAWQLLFEEMPIGALLRNLGSLTEIGVLAYCKTSNRNLDRVAKIINSKEHLRKGRIHPIDVLKALKTYRSGGSLGKSSKTWTPVPRIVDILELALEMSFETIEPTGKVFMHAVDISGSMSSSTVSSINLTCCEIATTMALVSAKAEKNYMIRGFSTEFISLKINSSDSFSSAMKKASNLNFGGTDASSAYKWMIKNKCYADVICFWTDCESWAGYKHPSQALAEYRQKVNPDAKAIYISLVANNITLVDPKDPNSWDLAGFDPSTPRLIQSIASGEL
ncbi:TROVE domain-containing protein [Chamaesiphon sp. OTE_8_metabat_110]|uniref:TROVE domain-containing protein n=1 Tax=Chamaesiphon sp. OTE_8_metabat_110 TaxID=2964696 RepID=UPI00286C8B0A|nr:TROVE domain-containing protein [Chamaesiphon sp. OTE_8_metabat_110]